MTTEAADVQDNMRVADKFRGGDGRRMIVTGEMRDNGYIRYSSTGRWRQRQRQRRGTGDRRNGDGEER